MSLADILATELEHYSFRKAEIAAERARLDAEDAQLDRNMTKLVDVVMAHTVHPAIPEPRGPANVSRA